MVSEVTDLPTIKAILRQIRKSYPSNVSDQIQEWDERVDFVTRAPDGKAIIEYISFSEISADRIAETCRRLEAAGNGENIHLVNRLSDPIRFSKL